MSAKIISGKEISKRIKEELGAEVAALKKDRGIVPGLAVILVGDNPASHVYVRNKEKGCEAAGIHSAKYELSEDSSEAELLSVIEKLNRDENIDGILVQLPLPSHMDEQKVLEAITPSKDVDGFHPYNVGKLMTGDAAFISCTPFGIMKMLEYSEIELEGRQAVIVGRSNIVGKPMALLLMEKNATPTICHSRSKPLGEYTRRADILVAAIGRAKMITADMVKPGAVVIDVGINRTEEGKLVGDVDFENVKEVAGAITPVPGGVGPMTIAMLLFNTVLSAKRKHGLT
ncbi:MAG: bifunctional methylenetetrahydrofolate dehydrogenase/methenyltetrahydrofolate cyclohydrolase FolD [bacterium]